MSWRSQASHCAVTYPKTELGQSTRCSHRNNHSSRPLITNIPTLHLCSSFVFSPPGYIPLPRYKCVHLYVSTWVAIFLAASLKFSLFD